MIAKETPLKGMNIGTVAAVAIRELPGLHTIDLRVAPGSPVQAAVAVVLGMDFPQPGKSSVISLRGEAKAHALCLGPDWWLITGLTEVEPTLASLRLTNDYHFSAVDVSGQRITVELEGSNARNVLAHLWEQDLREKSFPVGSVSQGLMAKAPVIVFCIATDCYRIMVRSSFALHLWKAVVDAAEEWI